MMARLVFERLDRVIAVTENVQRTLQQAGVRPKCIELALMCVDTERFAPQPPPVPPSHFPDNGVAVRVLFVGNASEEKGLAELLDAVKMLAQRKVPIFLVAALENQSQIGEYSAGRDRARDFIRRARLEHCVRLVGLVDSIDQLYAEADVLVIPWKTSRGPSDYPMVALEAMAMGKCVISTPVGGCPELLRSEAGILTDGFSAQHIATAIEYAVCHPETRARVGLAACRRAQTFSVQASAKRLLDLYERLLEGRTCSHATC